MQEAGTRLDHGGAALFRRRPEAPFAANAADLQQTAERRVPVHRTVSRAAVARAGRARPLAAVFDFFPRNIPLTHSIYSFSA
jgi:hypothetical protein